MDVSYTMFLTVFLIWGSTLVFRISSRHPFGLVGQPVSSATLNASLKRVRLRDMLVSQI